MNDKQKITNFFSKQAARQNVMNIISFAGRFFFCGAIAFSILSLLKLFRFELPAIFSSNNILVFFIIVFIAGIIINFARKNKHSEIAYKIDLAGNCEQIFSTAQKIISNNDNSASANYVLKQAERKIRSGIKLRFKILKEKLIALIAMILIALLLGTFVEVQNQNQDLYNNIADNINLLSSDKKIALAAKFAKSARKDRKLTKKEIRKITRTIEIGDRKQLFEMLKKLKMLGVNLKKILPDEYDKLSKKGVSRFKRADKINSTKNKVGSIKTYSPVGKRDSVINEKIPTREENISSWSALKNQAMQNLEKTKIKSKYISTMTRYFSDNLDEKE